MEDWGPWGQLELTWGGGGCKSRKTLGSFLPDLYNWPQDALGTVT